MLAFFFWTFFQFQIPAPTGFVNDFASVIDAQSRQFMTGLIEEVRAKSRGEIVVVTLRDIEGRASIEVARDIGREWRVGALGGPGDQARNAAVVVLLVPGERPGDGQSQLAIATGTGAEGFVTDARAGRIRNAIGRTAGRSGSYGAGLLEGVGLLAQAFAEEFNFELTGSVPVAPQPQRGRRRGLAQLVPLLFFILVFIILSSRGGRGGGGRYGRRGNLNWMLAAMLLGGMGRRGGWHGGGGGSWGGGGFGGGGFGGFGGGGGFSGGGASGSF